MYGVIELSLDIFSFWHLVVAPLCNIYGSHQCLAGKQWLTYYHWWAAVKGTVLLHIGIHPAWGQVTPFRAFFPPLSVHSLIFCFFYFFTSFYCLLYLFSILPIPSFFTRIVTTAFPGRRSRETIEPGFSLFRFSFCYLYCLVKIYSGVLLHLV